jgi:hypothetical protein
MPSIMKLFDEVRAPLMFTPWNPPPGRCCTPGMMLSSELKSRPESGISSMRALSTRLFNLSEYSTSGDTPSTVTVSDTAPTSSRKSVLATAFAVTGASRATPLKPASSAVTR